MRQESKWKHENLKDVYVGKYERVTQSHKRIFVLISKVDKQDVIYFDSHEKAKDAKWEKVK